MGLIGLLAFIFVGLTLINRMLEGAFISTTEVEILNNLTVFRSVDIGNLFSIPVLNFSFITSGLPHLVKWDYSFFGGNGAIIAYFLSVLSVVVGFLILTMVLNIAGNFISRIRS